MLRTILISSFSLLIYFQLSAQLTIIVDAIPSNTPENDPIHIAGDFQGWDPTSSAEQLMEDDNGHYYIHLPSVAGSIEFKFARGTWEKVEADENGNFIPNRFYSGNAGDTITLQILGWEDLDGGGGGESTAAENVQILTDSFYMPQFDRYRRVWIYLPPDYEMTNFSYPVLYMHDGQNVFDALTSFVGEWEVDETLNALHAEGDTGIIVVAVDNGGADRIDEYTPWSNPTYGGGDGGIYVNFIVETLKPYIDDQFRTLSDRANTGIMGSSLGGLISTYAGIEHQDVFGKIGAFSPSYWFSPNAYTHVNETGKNGDMRIYQLMGTLESSSGVPNMVAMEETLHLAGFEDDEVLSVEKADGQHSEWFWAREFEAAYLWLFRDLSTTTRGLPTNNLRGARLYPNPTEGPLTLAFYLTTSDYIRIDIVDSSGQQIKGFYGNSLSSGAHQIQLDFGAAEFAAGNYFLKLHSREGEVLLPFVKM